MRAIMLMFDSLNRHMLPPYGSQEIIAPNFERLAARTTTFDNCYAGSMPCMPSRRELHTGRYNFLHRSWGSLEPFDDSMPAILKSAGVHCHLVSDHHHYWEDGGGTYHPRYSTWEIMRGQEGDPWKGRAAGVPEPTRGPREMHRQDRVNREYYRTEDQHPQTRTVDAGLEFIRDNADADRWFVQIECFDPHEPFVTYDNYRELYPKASVEGLDWPRYAKVTQRDDVVNATRLEYSALVSMCDRSLGRVLDAMDEHGLWDDTMLIVNTDHGFLLGEHGWWAKSVQPWFNELIHLPLFLWDPRAGRAGDRENALVQTIDIAPTLLGHFGIEPTTDMQGRDLAELPAGGELREGALFGIHGGHANVTDGRYVYMRAAEHPSNAPLHEYTVMPTRMRGLFSVEEMATAELASPFSFSKGVPLLKTQSSSTFINSYLFGTLLYDLEADPEQRSPIVDDVVELRMLSLLQRLMQQAEAPIDQFERIGLPATGPVGRGELRVRDQRQRARSAALPVPPLDTLPRGRRDVGTPIALLISDPAALAVLHAEIPALTRTEVVNGVGDLSIHDLAATVPMDEERLRRLSERLVALGD